MESAAATQEDHDMTVAADALPGVTELRAKLKMLKDMQKDLGDDGLVTVVQALETEIAKAKTQVHQAMSVPDRLKGLQAG
eukprot:3223871-Amphidinium_carterae.1